MVILESTNRRSAERILEELKKSYSASVRMKQDKCGIWSIVCNTERREYYATCGGVNYKRRSAGNAGLGDKSAVAT